MSASLPLSTRMPGPSGMTHAPIRPAAGRNSSHGSSA